MKMPRACLENVFDELRRIDTLHIVSKITPENW